MDWNKLAEAVAGRGRNGDSMLAHVTPEEVRFLKARGGAGTVNPETGLYEFYDDPGSGSQAGPGGSGNPGGLSMDNTAAGDTGKSPNAIDWGGGFSLSSLANKATGAWDDSGAKWSTDPVAKGVQMAAGAMVPGASALMTGGRAFAAGMEMLGGKGITDQQAAAQGAAYDANPSSGDRTASQPLPDTSTIGATATASPTLAPTAASGGQDLSGLADKHGLPPSVLDYLMRIGVLAL